MEQNAHPARKVAVADHIWDAFEQMAHDMGSDRDGLINQAMFMFARLNGFLEAGGGRAAGPSGQGQSLRTEAVPAPRPVAVAAPPAAAAAPASPPPRPAPGPAPAPASRPAPVSRTQTDEDSSRRGVAERVLETAAELERLIQKKNQPQPPPDDDMVDEPMDDEPMDEPLDDDLESMAEDLVGGDEAVEDEELPPDDGSPALYLTTDAGNTERITKDRFVIGRGKHCDFVINSGKVSREHAQIIREGADFFIEDLGSSNGTWFQKQRIKRRKIEDGDEYLICNEKVKLAVR